MKADGGPAFPSVGEGFGNPNHSAPGMTLRDWFAGMAMQGFIIEYGIQPRDGQATIAFAYADEMLKARGERR